MIKTRQLPCLSIGCPSFNTNSTHLQRELSEVSGQFLCEVCRSVNYYYCPGDSQLVTEHVIKKKRWSSVESKFSWISDYETGDKE